MGPVPGDIGPGARIGRVTGDGRRATGDGRRATGPGRRATGDGLDPIITTIKTTDLHGFLVDFPPILWYNYSKVRG